MTVKTAQAKKDSVAAGTLQICALFARVCAMVALLFMNSFAFAQQTPEAAVSEENIKKAVLEVNEKMTQAANSMNVETFFAYIAENGVIIQNGTVFKTRQEAMQALKRSYMGVAKVSRRFDNPQVTVISKDLALLASEGSVSATLNDGRQVDSRFAVSLIFAFRDGNWKLLQGHYSMPVKL